MFCRTLRQVTAGLLVWGLIVGGLALVSQSEGAECLGAAGGPCVAQPPVYTPTGNWVLVQDNSGRPGVLVREIRRF